MMFWYGNGMGGWGWGLMAFSFIVFWALVVLAVVLLVRHFSRSGQQSPSGPPQYGPPAGPPPSSPGQLLAERYARGEIDDAEYQQRQATLRGAGAVAGSGQADGRSADAAR